MTTQFNFDDSIKALQLGKNLNVTVKMAYTYS